MSSLFTPIRLRGLTLANRIMVAPMCQYMADDGAANDWHFTHINSLALSGAAMFCIEATAVEPIGRITPRCLGLWNDATAAALAPILASVRRHSSCAVAIQLGHAGRKGSCARPWEGGKAIPLDGGGWQTVGPSALGHNDEVPPPLALDDTGLTRIRDAFASAAHRAMQLGLDAVELQCAHGYLLHQFLSPISNRRTDRYGGSLENRMRFPLAVFDAIRAVVPVDKPVGVRVSATDWIEGGWDLAQTIAFAIELRARGLDWIDVSSGGVSPKQTIAPGPGYQAPMAEAIRRATGLTTIAVGLITEPQQADEIIASGKADMVALARGMLYDPRWGWHAAASLGDRVATSPSYWRAPPHELSDLFEAMMLGAR